MRLASAISLNAGGPGSGCKGPNCGRPATGFRSGRRGSAIQRVYDFLADGQSHTMAELQERFGTMVRNVPYRVQILSQYGRRQGNFEIRRSGNTVRLVPTSTVQPAQRTTTTTTTPTTPSRVSTTTPTMPPAPPPVAPTNTNASFRKPTGYLAKQASHTDPAAYVQSLRGRGIQIRPTDIVPFEQQFRMSPEDLKAQLLKGVPQDQLQDLGLTLEISHVQGGSWTTRLDGNGMRQERDFNLANGSVYHSYWRIPPNMQASGLGKTIFNNYLELYDHLGIKKIDVGANIDVGGYAWARYGFVPDQLSWDSIRASARVAASNIPDPSLRARVKLITEIRDPKAMWLLAGLKDPAPSDPRKTIGQKLLLGKTWHGSINLDDVENYSVVSSYVKPKEERTTRAAAEPYGIANGKKIDAPFHQNMLSSNAGEEASDLAAVGVALDHGWLLKDAVRWLVRSPKAAQSLLAIQAGGPGSGCRGSNCGRPSTHSSTTESRTMSGWHREYTTPAGTVTVGKFKPITRGSSPYYFVRHPDGTEKKFKLGFGQDQSGKVAAYLEKHFGVVDGDVTRSVQAGGPGSGCKGPNCGRKSGGKKWKNMTDEERREVARRDPRQQSLFEPKTQVLANPRNIEQEALDLKSAKKYKEAAELFDKAAAAWEGMGRPDAARGSRNYAKLMRELQQQRDEAWEADADGEPMVGNMSRKHINEKNDYFVPKPGKKGGVQAGGPGSGCKGQNCGRHKNADLVPYYKLGKWLGVELHVRGKTVGYVHADVHGKRLIISLTQVNPEYEGRGHARALYTHLFNVAKSLGFTHVRSSLDLTEGGYGVWRSLKRKDANIKYSPPKRGAYQSDGYTPSRGWFVKKLAGASLTADGEPEVPSAGMGVIEPLHVLKQAHPPSLKNAKRVPTDDPGETDDTYGDVSKRNSPATQKQRADLLKRSIPGGNPPLVPAVTTLIPHHTAVYQHGMFSSAEKKRVKSRPVAPGPWKPKRTFVPFSRRGSA